VVIEMLSFEWGSERRHMTIAKGIGYLALAALTAGILLNLDDIRRYVRISRM